MSKRILFIKKGSFSNTNQSIIEQLSQQFPDYQVEVFDLLQTLKKHHKVVFLFGVVHLVKDYGWDLITGNKPLTEVRQLFFCTPFIFQSIKKIINEHLKGRDAKYAFSFQTQSYFDGSTDGIPHFIYTDHTMYSNYHYPYFNSKKYQRIHGYMLLEKQIYKNAASCFFMSEHVRNTISEYYGLPDKKAICVKAGSNINIELGNQERPYDSKHILFVGIDWERKGGPILVEAFKLLQQKHPDAQLSIVGCKPKLKVKNCHVYGKVSKIEVAKFFRVASVFCLPTRREPFGIVFVEAMMYRLPIVAGKLGALPELVISGENGILTNNSVYETYKALKFFIENPHESRNYGMRGYEMASKEYTYEAVGLKMKHVINRELDNINSRFFDQKKDLKRSGNTLMHDPKKIF